MYDIKRMAELSGVQLNEDSSGAADIAANPIGNLVPEEKCETPTDITKSLKNFIKQMAEDADAAEMKGQNSEASICNTKAMFASELLTMLDGSPDGFTRAATHVHTAANHIVNALPSEIVTFLTSNEASVTKDESAEKETQRKHLSWFAEELRNKSQ